MTTPSDSDQPRTRSEAKSVLAASVPAATEPRPALPTPVVVSFWILIVSAALRFFFAVVTAVNWTALINDVLQHLPAHTSPAQVRSDMHNILIAEIVLDVVFGALYVVLAFMIRAGRNWARLSVTAVVVVFGVFDILNGPDVVTLISVLIELVAVGLLYLQRSKDFFAAVKAATPSRFRR
ncbi:MAG TPA: hypothetical protein VH352_02200 [Pseudonocardiaceae bacterium]|nr:hypothetical protein [Pseudonocardiaceae bacterium]